MPSTTHRFGDSTKTTSEMGSLYIDYANERVVHIDDYENWDDYRVYIYDLDENGELRKTEEFWTYGNPDQSGTEIDEFVTSSETAYLSGHNFPGSGYYGVFVGPAPNCPECGAFMSPGAPDFHAPRGQGIAAVGYTCKKYERTNGMHEGYMTQKDAIRQNRYLTITDILRQAF